MSDAPSGILNLHKPAGPTSHDCVARVRRVLSTRRVGHAGTLDPMATGVLVIGVGQGTRILEYAQGLPKTYRASVRFGLETDSQDTTGSVLAEADASEITEERLREALRQFEGEILQVPPMVSALKVGGKKLYELARAGQTVEREARPVTIYSIELLDFVSGPRAAAELRVRCSAGTYVRTLCHDLGRLLGPGAAMSALEREAVGHFTLAEAVPLDELTPETPLIPPAEALRHLPRMTAQPEQAVRLAHGQFLSAPDGLPDGPICVVDNEGRLLAIASARGHGENRLLTPEKVFSEPDAARSGS
ncbi:MAG: tRNA pseudouridine(55) synthase TruB [Armatimonadota bacterium]